MKLDKQKSNLKYYYQTQDYKIHAYKNIPEFLDKYVSEIALQNKVSCNLLDNKYIQCIYYKYWRYIMQAVVQKWGNSLGFRIPSLWAKDNNVKNGSKIEVIAEKGKIIILPQKKTLDDMLALVTPENLHSEISTGSSVGNEEW